MDTPVGQPAKTYSYKLCADSGFCLENLSTAMADGDG